MVNLVLTLKNIKQNTNICHYKIDEEIIMDKIIEALNNKPNDELYIERLVGSDYFTVKRADGR